MPTIGDSVSTTTQFQYDLPAVVQESTWRPPLALPGGTTAVSDEVLRLLRENVSKVDSRVDDAYKAIGDLKHTLGSIQGQLGSIATKADIGSLRNWILSGTIVALVAVVGVGYKIAESMAATALQATVTDAVSKALAAAAPNPRQVDLTGKPAPTPQSAPANPPQQ